MTTKVPLHNATTVGNTGPSHSGAGPKVRKGYRDGSARTDRGNSNRCGVSVHHLGISEDELFGVGMLVRVSGDSVEVEVPLGVGGD